VFRSLRSCFGKLVVLVLLIVAAYVGWVWGPAVFPRVQEWLGLASAEDAAEMDTSPELADSVVSKVQAFRGGEEGDRMTLSGRELTSVLRHSIPGLIPEGTSHPQVRLVEGKVRLRADVALSAFPELPDLGPILGILPDTLAVEVEASVLPFGAQEVAVLVEKLEAGRIPLPGRLIPEILEAMGRVESPGLPPEGLRIPLPSGLASAYLVEDSLVLFAGS
jgi:hypothetical protein